MTNARQKGTAREKRRETNAGGMVSRYRHKGK